jgi:hypothetical protein
MRILTQHAHDAARLVGGLAAAILLFACGSQAPAAPSTVTPETMRRALDDARPGDVLRLAPGRYGDLDINNRRFETPIRIVPHDPANPPVFNTITIRQTEGVSLEGVAVLYQPTEASREHSPVIGLENCKRVSFIGGRVASGPSVNGVPEDAPKLDGTGNVQGRPTGRIRISKCQEVAIERNDISNLGRGIVLADARGVRIVGNNIHDLRRTAVLGAASDLLIEGNRLHDVRPWRWGQTPVGDHADFIALWSPQNGGPYRNIRIINNIMAQQADTAILGMWLAGPAGYEDVEIRGNVISGTDHQGIVLSDTRRVVVAGNTLYGAAQMLFRPGVTDAEITGNAAAGFTDRNKGETGVRMKDNRGAPKGRWRDPASN